jgi:choline dehydrogenase-like flavoprotein
MIDPAYYSHPADMKLMSHAILRTLEVAAAHPLSSYLKDMDPRSKTTLEDAVQLAKDTASTIFHPVGTCAMLPLDKGGVVNERLVVYGTTNLRVVDASIFPMQVQGNIVSLVYAVAEKAADVIKQDQK